MKKMIFLIVNLMIFSLTMARNTPIVFNEETSKVLYADYPNHIRVFTNNNNSSRILLKGESMNITNEGNGIWVVTPYLKKSEAVIQILELRGRDTVEIAQDVFAVKALPRPCAYVTFNEKEMQHHHTAFINEEFLNNPCKIKVDFGEGFPLECPIEIYSFSVVMGEKVINCKGNTISQEVKDAIKIENQNVTILIKDIRAIYRGNLLLLTPITIELLDKISYDER